jgi:hypothetical protein
MLAVPPGLAAAETLVERGGYLVAIGGCNDGHTPGSFPVRAGRATLHAGFTVVPGDVYHALPKLPSPPK